MAGNKVYVQGSYVDVHDNEVVNLSIDKVGTLQVGEAKVAGAQDEEAVPELLRTPEATTLMETLVEAGILTVHWQPMELSGSERGLVAKAVSDRLDIKEVWQVFGQLWEEKPESLRMYFNRALEQVIMRIEHEGGPVNGKDWYEWFVLRILSTFFTKRIYLRGPI